MSLYTEAVAAISIPKAMYSDSVVGPGATPDVHVMVAKCAEDSYGLIICELVDGERCANPPNVLVSTMITEELKFDFTDSLKNTLTIVDRLVYRYLKFNNEVEFWRFCTVISTAKIALANHRTDLETLMEDIVQTVPMV